MTTPIEPKRVPPYVALVRIGAVVGMSTAMAFAIFFAIAAHWPPALIALALAVPFFVVMRLVENLASEPEPPPTEQPPDE
ncbi:MAG: hypothetical protein WBD55_04910 [Dehalococcoidia bacterium]